MTNRKEDVQGLLIFSTVAATIFGGRLLLTALFLIIATCHAHAGPKNITSWNLPKTLYVKGIDRYIGKVISIDQPYSALVYHEDLNVMFTVSKRGYVFAQSLHFSGKDCTGKTYLDDGDFWRQSDIGFLYNGGEWEIYRPEGDAFEVVIKSSMGINAICYTREPAEKKVRDAVATGKYIGDGPYRIVERTQRVPKSRY